MDVVKDEVGKANDYMNTVTIDEEFVTISWTVSAKAKKDNPSETLLSAETTADKELAGLNYKKFKTVGPTTSFSSDLEKSTEQFLNKANSIILNN